MIKILGIEKADKRMTGKLYVAVVQVVLLFWLEMWVVNTQLGKALVGFHHWAVQRMVVMGPERQLNRTWVYQPIGSALATVGLEEIGVYTSCRKNTVTQYIAGRPIMDLFLAAERKPRMQLSQRWWDYTTIYILRIRAAHAAADMGEEMGTEE